MPKTLFLGKAGSIRLRERGVNISIIEIGEYPFRLRFIARDLVPPLSDCGYRLRTQVIRVHLNKDVRRIENHTPDDFTVEQVIEYPWGEMWYLGS